MQKQKQSFFQQQARVNTYMHLVFNWACSLTVQPSSHLQAWSIKVFFISWNTVGNFKQAIPLPPQLANYSAWHGSSYWLKLLNAGKTSLQCTGKHSWGVCMIYATHLQFVISYSVVFPRKVKFCYQMKLIILQNCQETQTQTF